MQAMTKRQNRKVKLDASFHGVELNIPDEVEESGKHKVTKEIAQRLIKQRLKDKGVKNWQAPT